MKLTFKRSIDIFPAPSELKDVISTEPKVQGLRVMVLLSPTLNTAAFVYSATKTTATASIKFKTSYSFSYKKSLQG